MRFMQFRAHDKYALHLSKMEKREKERGSHLSYMFRLPFAAGSVFSASMLDTLLYQAFVKDYVITFMKITKDDMWIRTYGRLYQKLCSTTCEIPIGIYRTQDTSVSESSHVSMSRGSSAWSSCVRVPSVVSLDEDLGTDRVGVTYRPKESTNCLGCTEKRNSMYSMSMADEARDNHEQQIERAEIANLVRSRMESLNLPPMDYNDVSEKRNSLSYVIINPSCDLKLEEGDIIYLVRPSPFSAQKTFERHNSRRKSNISFCSQSLIQQMAGLGSRRGSGLGLTSFQTSRAPPLATTKSNSLSLPDSPTVAGYQRGRSNSLRVIDDILLRRSNSLRQGLTSIGSVRRKSSLEDIGLSHFSSSGYSNYNNPIKIALNGSIGLEVTPPEENSPPVISSNTALIINPPTPSGMMSKAGSTMSLSQGVLPSGQPLNLGINPPSSPPPYGESACAQQTGLPITSTSTDPQHLQGTIV
ncbi:hypothetical protein FQR65_LT04882 [Abscondita terminalis]|nr:hypothetical protein FQR65_LT04882 [Abscondita terminalis]